MKDKVCLITGASSGIGKVTALELARKGARVVLAVRNRRKGEAVQAAIQAASGSDTVDLLVADLAALEQVRRLAEEFRAAYPRLDVLVNNAGLYCDRRLESADGYEMTFAVNHFAHFLLTALLSDTLKASAPARIVTVASGAHQMAVTGINFDDLQSRRGYNGWGAYGQSKLANIMFTYELAERLAGSGVTANCLHPGFVASSFFEGLGNGLVRGLTQLARPLMRSPAQGAQTSIYLASAPEVEGVSGKYFADKRPVRSSTASYDRASWRRLWEVSEQLVGLTEPAVR